MAIKTTETYTDEQTNQKLTDEPPDWELRDGWIRRKHKTGGWQHTLVAVNAIGYIAEATYHHPDLSVSWGRGARQAHDALSYGHHRQRFRAGEVDRTARHMVAGRRFASGRHCEHFQKKWTH